MAGLLLVIAGTAGPLPAAPPMPAVVVTEPTPAVTPPSYQPPPSEAERSRRFAQAFPPYYVPTDAGPAGWTSPPPSVFEPIDLSLSEIPLADPLGGMVVPQDGGTVWPASHGGSPGMGMPVGLPVDVSPLYVPGTFAERDVSAVEQARSSASDRPSLQVTAPTLSDYKSGFFQKLSLSGAYLGSRGLDNVAVTEVVTYLSVAVPAPTVDWPMLITPGYEIRLLDGPDAFPAPSNLHSLYLQFLWVPQITEQIQLLLAVQPGIYSSFEPSADLGFRMQQRALVRYQWLPGRLEIIGGVIYLDRDDIRQLPAGGVIWTPNADWRIEAIFPTPKVSRRIGWTSTTETWGFVRGEFGGDTWAVEPLIPLAESDRLTLSDLRVSAGIEQKRDGGAGMALEAGYVFSRKISRASGPSLDMPSTLMLRAIVAF